MSEKSAQEGFLFERFIGELLSALGLEIVSASFGEPDIGYDFLATEKFGSHKGKIFKLEWLVIAKNRRKGRIWVQDLSYISSMLKKREADGAIIVMSGNLTSAARKFVSRFNAASGGKLKIWDRNKLVNLLARFPDLQKKYDSIIAEFPSSISTPQESSAADLLSRLANCPAGKDHCHIFEELSIEILTRAFVPPLKPPKKQPRTMTGLERRDALFSLRGVRGSWKELRKEFNANFLLCEFKNYSMLFGKNEVNQTRNYLKRTIGRLAIIFSRNGPDEGALKTRNGIYAEEQKVILFFEDLQLTELLCLREANQDPTDLIQDAIEDFYISYE